MPVEADPGDLLLVQDAELGVDGIQQLTEWGFSIFHFILLGFSLLLIKVRHLRVGEFLFTQSGLAHLFLFQSLGCHRLRWNRMCGTNVMLCIDWSWVRLLLYLISRYLKTWGLVVDPILAMASGSLLEGLIVLVRGVIQVCGFLLGRSFGLSPPGVDLCTKNIVDTLRGFILGVDLAGRKILELGSFLVKILEELGQHGAGLVDLAVFLLVFAEERADIHSGEGGVWLAELLLQEWRSVLLGLLGHQISVALKMIKDINEHAFNDQ